MAYVEVHAELRDHPKTKKAARALGVQKAQMIGHLVCLWWWCQAYAPDGDLSDFDAADIAEAGEWDGDPVAFVRALTDCGVKGGAGFLADDGGALVVNDWSQYGGKLAAKREQSAQRMRNMRGRIGSVTRNDSVTCDDVTHIEEIREDKNIVPIGTSAADAPQTPAVPPSAPVKEKSAKAPKGNPYRDHPAVVAYRDVHGRWPQNAQMVLIAEADPPLADWVRALRAWASKGYSPTNIGGMLDWAKNPKVIDRALAGGAAAASGYGGARPASRVEASMRAVDDVMAMLESGGKL